LVLEYNKKKENVSKFNLFFYKESKKGLVGDESTQYYLKF